MVVPRVSEGPWVEEASHVPVQQAENPSSAKRKFDSFLEKLSKIALRGRKL